MIEETKAKNRAILNLFLNSMLNAKVKKDATNVINKITKANIFKFSLKQWFTIIILSLEIKMSRKILIVILSSF